jgi:hypothetical protein
MSSATSIEKPSGFGVWHFFILLSLIAATAAVLLTRQNTPENLILISLTIGAAGVAAAALYRTLAPLAAADHDVTTQTLTDGLRADLEREKALVLRSIKELEFDRAMGKLSEPDFADMAGRLRSRAIGLMKQLDEGASYRSLIERDLQARIAEAQARPVSHICACGTTNDLDAKFCKSCGSKLEKVTA